MKPILKSLILFAIILVMSNTTMAQQKNNPGKAVIKTTLNCDHCKKCETCDLKFKTEILKIKGVKMYELDDKAMTFTVYFNPKKTDLNTIKIAISKLGYDADEVKATLEGIATLDGCCKV
jgi:copper chaperone CopZ